MKFKTVSEFIHALEVEGKKFEHPYDENYFIGWRSGNPREITKDTLASYDFYEWKKVLTHDWQEYHPVPETEEIELEEWLVGSPFGDHLHPEFHFKGKSPQGSLPSYKTGQTRKVKVPK